MDEVIAGLYVSDILDVRENTLPDGVTHVVSVCQDTCEQNISDDVAVVSFPLADDVDKVDKYGGTTGRATFRAAASYVLDILERGGTIVLHCHSGQNRSCSVATAVIGRMTARSYDEAFDVVKDARLIANPTPIMEQHAREYIRGIL